MIAGKTSESLFKDAPKVIPIIRPNSSINPRSDKTKGSSVVYQGVIWHKDSSNILSGMSPYSSGQADVFFPAGTKRDHSTSLEQRVASWDESTDHLPRMLIYQLLHAHYDHLQSFNILSLHSQLNEFVGDLILVFSARPDSARLFLFYTNFIELKFRELISKKILKNPKLEDLDYSSLGNVINNLLSLQITLEYILNILKSNVTEFIPNIQTEQLTAFKKKISRLEILIEDLNLFLEQIIQKNTDKTIPLFPIGTLINISQIFDEAAYQQFIDTARNSKNKTISNFDYGRIPDFYLKSYAASSKTMYDYLVKLNSSKIETEAKDKFMDKLKLIFIKTGVNPEIWINDPTAPGKLIKLHGLTH
jgi:hypothetical protein